jgi:hypothetical protein
MAERKIAEFPLYVTSMHPSETCWIGAYEILCKIMEKEG